jgi:hypothetical protein
LCHYLSTGYPLGNIDEQALNAAADLGRHRQLGLRFYCAAEGAVQGEGTPLHGRDFHRSGALLLFLQMVIVFSGQEARDKKSYENHNENDSRNPGRLVLA